MELILENPTLFKKSIEIIADFVLEGTFVFKKDYLELVALNTNNVVMVIFRLLSTNFTKYEIDEDKAISLSLENLRNILKSCNDKGELKLILDDENKIKIVSLGKTKKEFELSLIEFTNENLQKAPSLNFPIKISSNASNFTTAINDLGFLEEGVGFRVSDKKFSLEGKTAALSGKIDFEDEIDIQAEDGKNYFCRYSMDYLKKFTKGDKLVKNVEISFNEDYPLKIEYKLVDKLLLSFILAPRGED